MAAKKKKMKKPAYMSVRKRWTRNPKTRVKADEKAKADRKKCRAKEKPDDGMCAAA